ncbi:hypothetical protein HAX54_010004 [Datura stramonium]|uniref:Uncharacterized protein n=1 Tax=Datura stramonium TaxID=4076 RepID=A0ABS8WYC8_DATST|nr:hypothetical protein [Datura stramonium]
MRLTFPLHEQGRRRSKSCVDAKCVAAATPICCLVSTHKNKTERGVNPVSDVELDAITSMEKHHKLRRKKEAERVKEKRQKVKTIKAVQCCDHKRLMRHLILGVFTNNCVVTICRWIRQKLQREVANETPSGSMGIFGER